MIEEKLASLGGVSPINSDGFDGLSKQEIQAVENEVGAALPDDYKSFLTLYGQVLFNKSVGFKPVSEEAVYPDNDETGLPNPNFKGSQVSVLFGKDPNYSATLTSKLKVYKDRMPEFVIPIGDDGLGNKICLELGKANYGSVYWWDHENEWDEEDYEDETGEEMPEKAKYQNIYLLAESFDDFVNKLYVLED